MRAIIGMIGASIAIWFALMDPNEMAYLSTVGGAAQIMAWAGYALGGAAALLVPVFLIDGLRMLLRRRPTSES